jgi:hypothetical protein
MKSISDMAALIFSTFSPSTFMQQAITATCGREYWMQMPLKHLLKRATCSISKQPIAFRMEILEMGGTRNAMQMYVNFRGKEPGIEPLLKQRGLVR